MNRIIHPPRKAPREWPREAAGGLIAGLVAVVYALSYAALLFTGPLRELLPLGVGLCLVNAVLGAFWLAWRSQLPFAIAGSDGNTTAILAAMAATVGAAGAAGTGRPIEQVLFLLMLTTLLCAVLFLVLGFGRLGLAVRYIPYPVIGGFLASTGWLIATGALRVGTDMPGGLEALASLPRLMLDPRLHATLAIALGCLLARRFWPHPGALPLALLAGTAAVLAGLAATGIDLDTARSAGWFFDSAPVQWVPSWKLLNVTPDWRWLGQQWIDMLAVATVAIITVLLGATGLEVMSHRDISLDRELRTHGWLNLLTATLGGYVSLVSVSRSAVLLESGARSRGAGVVAAAVCAVAMGGAAMLLGAVPKVVPAAFLLYLGVAMLHEWLVASRKHITLSDWTLIVAIMATTAAIGFTVAVLIGILASCLNFALNYSRVGVVQHDLDGRHMHSAVARPAAQRHVLAQYGQQIRVLVLRGVIFFGTSSSLLERMRAFLEPQSGTGRSLVLDFTHVAGADSSAAMTFSKIAQLARASGVTLLLCGMNRQTAAAVINNDLASVVSPTLDLALETAEAALLSAYGFPQNSPAEPLDSWLLREMGDPAHVERLLPLLVQRKLKAGEALVTQGEASNASLYLIESGRLVITLNGQEAGQRLASLMSGNIVGEMALYSNADRSANVTAEADTVVWTLTRAALEGLHTAAPGTAMQFHAFVMRTMAERVQLANGTIAALQRDT